MRFISKKKDFRLIIRATETTLDGNRRVQTIPGEKVEFKQGVFVTQDKSLIDYLLHCPLYGIAFTSEIGNDPIQIEKHSLVFDDGAELSGPKLVAGFPERNKPEKPPVEMITGAVSTVSNPAQAISIGNPQQVTPVVVPAPQPIGVSKLEVEALIDSKLDAFLDKIGSLVIQPSPMKKSPAKPKEWHCGICGEQLSSGFAVKKHREEKHSN